LEDLKKDMEAAMLAAITAEELASRDPEFIPEELESSSRPADALSPQPNPVNRPSDLISE
jgi:hypothetical protein